MVLNRAAWLTEKVYKPLEVEEAPYTKPGPNEIVIRSCAVATNPADYYVQTFPKLVFSWAKYPAVPGFDVAGEIAEVGPNVTRFKTGERVVGLAMCLEKVVTNTSEGAFQNYVLLREKLVSQLPSSISYEAAVVLPLGISSAACALFREDQLALDLPRHPAAKPTGDTVLIWGASSAVGSNAVQLAVAAGYDVFATAGPRNHGYVQKLGASEVFDYRDKEVVSKILATLNGRKLVGAVALGEGSMFACIQVVGAATPARKRKFIAQLSVDNIPKAPFANTAALVRWGAGHMYVQASTWYRAWWHGLGYKFVNGGDVVQDALGDAIFREFLPAALSDGAYHTAPEPMVVGHGLEKIQDAIDMHKKGMSAKKPVVTL